jgi:hypothetical protein
MHEQSQASERMPRGWKVKGERGDGGRRGGGGERGDVTVRSRVEEMGEGPGLILQHHSLRVFMNEAGSCAV